MGEYDPVVVSSPEHGFIWIAGGIRPATASAFRWYASRLRRESAGPVLVYITGPGGQDRAMAQIYEIIEKFPRPMITVAHGTVASASFLLTQAGANRLAVRGTVLHFHLTSLVITPEKSLWVDKDLANHFLSEIQKSDAESLAIFARRGRPFWMLQELLEGEARIGVAQGRKLCLLDGVHSVATFLKHRRIARELIRNKRS